LKQKTALFWSLWAAIAGTGIAALLVVFFRISQSAVIYWIFTSVDRVAFVAALTATSWFFPGDRVQRIVSMPTFFDVVLILVTGLQFGFLGLCAGLLMKRRSPTNLW
jgi:hypothetical protein